MAGARNGGVGVLVAEATVRPIIVALMPALVLAPLALVAHRPQAARQPPWAADG